MLVCRTEENHHQHEVEEKIGLFCNIATQHVFESPDVDSIYEIPLILHNDNFDKEIVKRLKIKNTTKHLNIDYLKDLLIDSRIPMVRLILLYVENIMDFMMHIKVFLRHLFILSCK